MTDEKVQEPETYEIVTTAQVERTYTVLAADEDQAHKRLRTFLADPDMLKEGLVVEQGDKQIDSTPQRVKSDGVKKVTKPRAVRAPAEAAAS